MKAREETEHWRPRYLYSWKCYALKYLDIRLNRYWLVKIIFFESYVR